MTNFVIELNTGKPFDFNNPEINIPDIKHIAEAGVKLCRFACQVKRFYSVIEHELLVADLIQDKQFKIYGLVHDNSEVITGDVTTPMKNYLRQYTDAFDVLEDKIYEQHLKNIGLPKPSPYIQAVVNAADKLAFRIEKQLLTTNKVNRVNIPFPTGHILTLQLGTTKAENLQKEYLKKFKEYMKVWKAYDKTCPKGGY